MRIRRVLVGAVTGLVAALATAGPSLAQPAYPPAMPSVAVSATTVGQGDSAILSGTGFQPGAVVTATSRSIPERFSDETRQRPEVGGISAPMSLGPLRVHRVGLSARRPAAPARLPAHHLAVDGAADTGSDQGEDTTPGLSGDDPDADPAPDAAGTDAGGSPDRDCATGRRCYLRVDASGGFSVPFEFSEPGITIVRVHGTGLDGQTHVVPLRVTARLDGRSGVDGSGRDRDGYRSRPMADDGAPALDMFAGGVILFAAGTGTLLTALARRRRRAVGEH